MPRQDVEVPDEDAESIVSDAVSEVSVAEQLPIFEVLSNRNSKKSSELFKVDVVTAGFIDPESAEAQEIYSSADSEDPVAEPVIRLHGVSVNA